MLARLRSLTEASLALLGAAPPMPRGATPVADGSPLLLGRAPRGGSRVRRSLRASAQEGMLAEAFTAATTGAALSNGAVQAAWALHLGCGPLLVGLLGALPYLAQLVQFPSAWLTAWLGPRRTALWAVGASRMLPLPLALAMLLPAPEGLRRGAFLAVTALSALLGVVGNNAWVTWMGELVPARLRGRYFGRRTALCVASGTAAGLGVGLLLDAAHGAHDEARALALLSLLAWALGLGTLRLMARQHQPASAAPARPPSPAVLLEPLRDPNVRRVLAYNLVWSAAVGLSGGFYGLHMVKNLGMGFLLIACHGTATSLVRMAAAPAWGAAIDRVGARPVVVACSFGIAAIPLLWLFPAPGRLWPLAFDALLSGVLWCGHALATFHLPLRVAPRQHRAFHLAALSTAGGLAFALASAAGGLLAHALPAQGQLLGLQLVNLHGLFVLSSLGRLVAAGLALRLREPNAGRVEDLWRLAAEAEPPRPLRRAARLAGSVLRRRNTPPGQPAAGG